MDDVVAEAEEMCVSIFGAYTKYTFTLDDLPSDVAVMGVKESPLLDANYMIQANVG